MSLDLPLVGQAEEASHAKPFLGCSLVLDVEEIASLIIETKMSRAAKESVRPGLIIGNLDPDLQNAFARLVSLTQHPEQVDVLAPLIRREVYYRLLISEHSGLLQRMAAENGKLGGLSERRSQQLRHGRSPTR